jgi:hypothetical protein
MGKPTFDHYHFKIEHSKAEHSKAEHSEGMISILG